MTTITATELKQNLGKYFVLVQNEDIEVTKNGKSVMKLVSTNPTKRRSYEPVSSIRELFGIIHNDSGDYIDVKGARWEHLREKCGL